LEKSIVLFATVFCTTSSGNEVNYLSISELEAEKKTPLVLGKYGHWLIA
jgi:hypothetical protein